MVWPPDIRETIVNEDRDNRERALDIWLGLSGQAPLPEGPLVLPILSGSMRPSIALGSKILIAPADYSTCRLGDVVVYLEGDRLIAHRLLWTLGPFHFHKGDANPNGHWINCKMVRGIVREVLPAEDVAAAFPGVDPFSVAAAQNSRRQYLRNVVLAWPRWVRDRLTGNTGKETSGTNRDDP